MSLKSKIKNTIKAHRWYEDSGQWVFDPRNLDALVDAILKEIKEWKAAGASE